MQIELLIDWYINAYYTTYYYIYIYIYIYIYKGIIFWVLNGDSFSKIISCFFLRSICFKDHIQWLLLEGIGGENPLRKLFYWNKLSHDFTLLVIQFCWNISTFRNIFKSCFNNILWSFFLHIIKLNTLYYCSTVLLITFVYISYFVDCSFLKIYCDCEKWVSETQTKLVENL